MKFQMSLASIMAVLLLGVTASAPGWSQEAAPQKKLIWHGWGVPSARDVRANWRELDKLPLDGFSVVLPIDAAKPVTGDGSSQNRLAWNVFGAKPLQIEMFKSSIDDLKSAQWTNISSIFLPVAPASAGQDQGLSWFDDARWKTINNNWRVVVTAAKESGCKGILFDPEHYDYKPELFTFTNHVELRDKKTFEEYTTVARRRGRELMQSVKDVYPDMTMLCFYAYDLALYDEQSQQRSATTARYALLPAFLDGMLEGADPRTKWNDSWEFSYGYKQRSQFLEAYHSVRQKAQRYSKVPDLYSAKMRAGFGLMLDYNYANRWSVDDISRNHFSPADWRNAVRNALEVSDEYVIAYLQAPNFLTRDKMPDAYFQATAEGRLAARENAQKALFNAPVEWKDAPAKTPSVPPVAAAAPAAVPAGAASTAVVNADFEKTRGDAVSPQPEGWFVQRHDKALEADDPALFNGSGVVTDHARSGKNSYRFLVSDTVYAKFGENTVYRMGMLKSRTIPVEGGQNLTFSFWYYAADMKGAGDFVVQLHKAGPGEKDLPVLPLSRVQFDQSRAWRVMGPDAKIAAEENGWNKVEVRNIVVPAGYKEAHVMLQIQGKKPGDYLYADDLKIER